MLGHLLVMLEGAVLEPGRRVSGVATADRTGATPSAGGLERWRRRAWTGVVSARAVRGAGEEVAGGAGPGARGRACELWGAEPSRESPSPSIPCGAME